MPHPKPANSDPSSPQTPLRVQSLHYYPVKSCAGIDVDQAEIGERGINYDRGWLVVDSKDRFVTQRELPKMALIQVKLGENGTSKRLVLEAPGMEPIEVVEEASADRGLAERTVTVWKDTSSAIDQGDEAAAWLAKYLGKDSLRLVRMNREAVRPVKSERADATPSHVSFQDGYPFLIATTASLQELNKRLEQSAQNESDFVNLPLPMNRFRPNIVVEGAEPFAEDNWKEIKIGDVVFELDSGCARCTITTVNQLTADRGVEPLKTLATFRKTKDNEVMFGQNAIHRNSGTIKVNDEVEVIR